jgi:DMSO/TMAO reductase YedYZ molybdopterin-dependent catalytic subunit
VDFKELTRLCEPLPSTGHIIFESYDGYTTNVGFKELTENLCFIAFEMDDKDIEDKYGGPVRAVIPHLYGWKSAKHLKAIRFSEKDEPGFWEVRGYNNHGDPWKEERYS